jgi:hypothetical protein
VCGIGGAEIDREAHRAEGFGAVHALGGDDARRLGVEEVMLAGVG